MPRVTVLILHQEPGPDAGPLTRALADARLGLAEVHRRGFLAAGADEVRLVAGPPDDTPFGRRLRDRLEPIRGGLVVLGSGSLILATVADRRAFVAVAASGARRALANNRYSADAIAVGTVDVLDGVPDLEADNALARWLDETGRANVADLRDRWRLAVDLDGPLDVLLAARHRACPSFLRAAARGLGGDRVLDRVGRLAGWLADRRAEVLVAGRTSATTLRWLERSTAARIRALVEERGLRASDPLAQAAGDGPARPGRPPASILGTLLDRDGPEALGRIVAPLADAAVIDSRVLLAHRAGRYERRWPAPEDRFASDLLSSGSIADPWLRALTHSARDAAVPIVLGGHTLVGPGLRLIATGSR